MLGKIEGKIEGKRTRKEATEDEIVGWHHWFNGHEFEQTLGDGKGQGSLACCSPWVAKSQTWLSDWTSSPIYLLLLFIHFVTSMDYSSPGSALHGILQARILEWVAMLSPGDLPGPGIEPTSPALAGRFFTTESLGKSLFSLKWHQSLLKKGLFLWGWVEIVNI